MKPSRIRSLSAAPVALVTIAFLSLVCAASLQAQRLPSTVVPRHYALKLAPDLKATTFTGVETIDVTLRQPASAITLNAAEITFQSVTITAGGAQQTAQISLDKARQQATFSFERALPAGPATLVIHYTGILNNELRGFYLSKGDHRNYAVTQFEPTDARRAFPCFDEPAFKATFDISLVVDKGDTAISNNPIATDTPGPGESKHTLTFLTTPRMSTYLVAFLVGDFQCTAGEQDGVKIRVCATPDKVALTSYALGVARYALHYYDTYFSIPYPLKKLDLIALPDFEAGAMENFGAITYRETDLLLDPATATVDAKKNVAIVVAHEMAHQWFGDLVTMQWWDNVWLNEGFATWMENKLVAAMHPEWNIDQDVASNMDGTLNIDARPTTRPIRASADTPAQINQMFDGIAYGKAGDVLLSVENYLGPETFRKGVQRYLRAHMYANATAQDFWNAETAVSRKPVDKIMDSLVSQPGVPLLIFGSPASGRVSVEQRRFFLTPSIHPDPAQKWTLPVCFKTSSGQHCEVITPSTASLPVPPSKLFFPNAGGKGYYRTAYSHSDYENLVAHVESELTPAERIMFIGDVWAQLRANKASAGDYLDLVAAVKSDSNAAVVTSVLGGVIALYVRAAPDPGEKAGLARWLRTTFSPEYARLGPPSATDSPNKRQLRAQLFDILGEYGKDPAVIAEARRIAGEFLANPSSVDPTLAQTALSIAAQNGDEALFDKLQKTYETSTDPSIQISALRFLALFQNPALVERALSYAVSGKVRNQDAAIQLAIALQDSETQNQAWQFIQAHWDKVKAQLTTEMGGILVNSTGAFCSTADRDSVEQFFSSHKVPASDVELKHALENINGCVELRALQEPKLKSWLAAQSGS